MGAFTPFLWMIKAREMIWDIMEEETGARLTHSFGRVGGMAHPPTEGFKETTRATVDQILKVVTPNEVPDGYAVLRTVTPNAAFLAYASVIDNRSGDPMYVVARPVQ